MPVREPSRWYLVGHRRTHREARSVWMKDLRTGQYARDVLGWLVGSTDFAALPLLQLSTLPSGASQPALTVTGQIIPTVALPTGRDGGTCLQCSGLADLQVVAYERPESAWGLGDVIVYDRRGQLSAPAAGPDTNWEEVYGPDYPWNWVTSGQPNDAPVLDNGLVRVRYDATVGQPGFRVDVWNGSAYVEQGKLCVQRIGDSTGYCNTFVSASLREWTPERGVMQVVLANSADAYSREIVYVTVQRGELAVTFECYPAVKQVGGQADAVLQWTPALNSGAADLNNTIVKIDSQGTGNWTPGGAGTAVIAATAGTGTGTGNSGQFGSSLTALGNANFTTSENWAALLRYPTAYNTVGGYQTILAVVQAANALVKYAGSSSIAYGSGQDTYQVASQNAAGYVQCQVKFAATAADQVVEAETIRNTGSGTTSQVTDATASGGAAVKDTQTADSAHTLVKASTTLAQAKYRIFARVHVDAGTTGVFQASLGATAGSTVSVTASGWTWIDLGELVAPSAGAQLALDGWVNMATPVGGVYVDRVELVLVENRTAAGAMLNGARDCGQAALADSRMLGDVVARTN